MDDEPQVDDYKLTPAGSLGGSTAVSCYGQYLGQFDSSESALEFIADRMNDEKYWPNIWWVSDHGNAWQIDREGKEIR